MASRTLTITVKGASGAGLANKSVTFTSDNPEAVAAPAGGTTNGSGVLQVTATRIGPGTAKIRALCAAILSGYCTLFDAAQGISGAGYVLFASDRADPPVGMSSPDGKTVTGTVYATPYVTGLTEVVLTDQGDPVLNGTALSNAIDAAATAGGGRVIRCAAGAVYRISKQLPNFTNWLYIACPEGAGFPAPSGGTVPGTTANRVGPAHASLMPVFENTSNNAPCFSFAAGGGKVRFIGLNCRIKTGTTTLNTGWIMANREPVSPSDYAHDVIVDRCMFRGDDTAGAYDARAVYANVNRFSCQDSYFEDLSDPNTDSQCVVATAFTSAWKLTNNYGSSAGENWMIGGGTVNVPGEVPSDIEIRSNFWEKQAEDNAKSEFTTKEKNLGEIKLARRVYIGGNRHRRMWHSAQDYAINIKTVNQGLSASPIASHTSNVTFHRNIIEQADCGISIGYDPENTSTLGTDRVHIVDNLVIANDATYGGSPRRPLMTAGTDHLAIESNTFVGFSWALLITSLDQGSMPGFIVRNNILRGWTLAEGGVNNQNVHSADGQGEGTQALNAHAPGWVFLGNAVNGTTNTALFPTGNTYVNLTSALGFVDDANGNYRLATGSALRGTATDGGDPGCDIDALDAALANH